MPEIYRRPSTDHTLIGRMIRAAKLDTQLYAEVEADTSATGQAALVVLLAALAGGVASPLPPMLTILGAFSALFVWYLSAYLIYGIGTRLLPEEKTQTNFGAVLRAVGFAYAPGVLRLLGVVADVRFVILFVSWIWILVATITAVRHVLSYSNAWRAAGVCVIPILRPRTVRRCGAVRLRSRCASSRPRPG